MAVVRQSFFAAALFAAAGSYAWPPPAQAWPPPAKQPLPMRLDEAPDLPLLGPFRDPQGPPATHYASYRSGAYGRWRYRLWHALDWHDNPALARDLTMDAWLARQLEGHSGFPLQGAGDKAQHWFVAGARSPSLRAAGDLVPPWLQRLDPHWAKPLIATMGCGRGGRCSLGSSFPAQAFVALWTELAPLAFPTPAWRCRERPTRILRIGREQAAFVLLRCDGSIAGDGLAQLSILARAAGTAQVTQLPDEPDPRAPSGEWIAGVRLLDPRILWLIAQISDRFRHRAITIYSGYRARASGEAGQSHGSLHGAGRALDIAVQGVKNEELLALCFALADTGCGYYPHNKFVHIDVRARSGGSSVWVDTAFAGEPSRYQDGWPNVVHNGRVVYPHP